MYSMRRVVWNVLQKGWFGMYTIRRVVMNVLRKKGGV